MKEDLPKILVVGVVLGLTAGMVVWFLERFESNRLHGEVRAYLEKYDEFRDYLNRGQGQGQGG